MIEVDEGSRMLLMHNNRYLAFTGLVTELRYIPYFLQKHCEIIETCREIF